MRRISCHRGVRYCLAIAIALFALATPCRSDDSQNKTAGSAGLSFAGKFANEKLTLELHDATDGYAGTIALGNNKFNATAKLVDGQLTGSFDANGTPFKFTATRSGDIVTLSSGNSTYTLKRVDAGPANPLVGGGSSIPAVAPASSTNPVARDVVRFVKYGVQDDPGWIGGEAMTLLVPAGWKIEGGMEWRPETYSRVQPHLRISDPNSSQQVIIYPKQTFTWGVRVSTKTYLGNELQPPPRSQFDALAQFVIPRFRPDLAGAKVVDQQELPKLAEAPSTILASLPGAPVHGSAGRVRFEYDLNGQSVQEDFYVRYLQRLAGPRNPQVSYWLIDEVYSARAPKGSLDKVAPILRTVANSQRLSLPWYNKLMQFVEMSTKLTIDRINQEGVRAQIRARMSDEIREANKQQYESHEKSEDASNQATSETMRDQQPWTTADGNKVELPFQYGIAWQGANGEYISTNDPQYNPNSDPNNTTTYTQLQKAPGLNGR